jgi:hypothetical protein
MNLGRQGNNNRIQLTWTNVPGELGYRIQRARDAAFTSKCDHHHPAGRQHQQPDGNVLDSVSRNPVGTTYYYRVQSVNPMPSGWSPTATIVTQ